MSDDRKPHDEESMRAFRHVAIGELGAGIVHEVRNLVTSIRGFAQIAARRVDDTAMVSELLLSIEQKSGHCVSALNRFLELSRSGTGKLDPLDVNEAVSGAEQLLRHHMQLHKIRFDVHLGEGLPEVMGERLLLQQAIVNLLLNAQQAMFDGGAITLESSVVDGNVEIRVSDTGPGIANDVRESIFEAGVTTKDDGCGYGLALCRDVMRRHAGTVTVDAAVTEGAAFVLRLPVREEPDG